MKTETNEDIVSTNETEPSKKNWSTPNIVLIEKEEIEKTHSVGESSPGFS